MAQQNKEPVEIISTYEVMPNMDLRPITATSALKPKIVPTQRGITKMKLLPPNQFVKIKPPIVNQKSVYALHEPTTLVQTPPTYTVRTQMKPIVGSSAASTGNTINISAAGVDGKVFTLKSSPTGTKMLSAPSSIHNTARKAIFTTTAKASPPKPNSGGSVMIGPQTIMKSQQHPTLIKMTTATVAKSSPDLSGTSIFDIPIVFADNDGNIPENSNISSIMTTTTQLPQLHASVTLPGSSTPIHMSSNPLQSRNIIINSIGPNKPNPNNKVLVFNRSTLKGQPIQMTNPMTNVTIATSSTGSAAPAVIKYTKVNVSNANCINMPVRNIGMIRPSQQQVFKPSSFTVGSKVELFNNSIIKASSPIIKGSTPMIKGASPIMKASSPIITTLGNRVEVLKSSVIKAATSPSPGKFQPIVINVDSDKTTIKNIIKVGDSQMKPNTILIKPGGLIPMMKPGILNRNLTVRKVVNIVQQKPVNTAASASTSTTTTIASHTNTKVD